MVEAATLEEKQAWVAALNAHTQYVEASLTAAMQLENREAATTAATPGTAAVTAVLFPCVAGRARLRKAK
jgi:hypothetical protein